MAARCGSTRGTPKTSRGRSTSAVGELRSREERAGLNRLETYGAFDEQVKETKRKLLEFLIDAKRAGQVGRRLRRPGQRQYAAELLRHSHRLRRLHGRSQSLQARQVSARHAHPDLSAGADRQRPVPTTC